MNIFSDPRCAWTCRFGTVVALAVMIPACGSGSSGAPGAPGLPGMSVSSAQDRVHGIAGNTIQSVPEASLTALPPGATTRTVMALSAVTRTTSAETSPVTGVYPVFIDPTPVGGVYTVKVWDPTTGLEFGGSGIDTLHLYIASFFSQ